MYRQPLPSGQGFYRSEAVLRFDVHLLKKKKIKTSELFFKVLVPKDPTFMGKMIEVDIYESGKHFMKGQPVSDARVYTPSISKPLAKGEVSGLPEEFRNRLGNHPSSVSHTSAVGRDLASSRMALRLQNLRQDRALRVSVGLALLALLLAFFCQNL